MRFSNTATYYLVIADEQGQQMQQREQFQIDIAFAIDDSIFLTDGSRRTIKGAECGK